MVSVFNIITTQPFFILKESASGADTPKRRRSSELTSSQESARKIATHDSDYVMVDSQSHLPTELFSKRTKAIVWGMQQRAIQVTSETVTSLYQKVHKGCKV